MMQSANQRALRTRQGGWAGAIMGLVAVAIVAFLAKETLTQFGLVPAKPAAVKVGTAGEHARGPVATDADADVVDVAPPKATNAIDKARAVEGILKRQADELAARIENEAK
jgi:hypothetical protein